MSANVMVRQVDMLDSFYIRNFRLFNELKVERTGRFNLIVGLNNSGKSCFLEAVHIYASRAEFNTLRRLIDLRGGKLGTRYG